MSPVQFITDVRRAARLAMALLRFFTLPAVRYLAGRPVRDAELGVRMRMLCERMGITFIKIGQFLAMRFDVLPRDACRELERLFESAPPLPFAVVRAIVAAELGAAIDARFAWFSEAPLASASIAQVHRATTLAGEDVAVKVQRPHVDRLFTSDIRNLRRFAAVVDAFHLFGRISTVTLVDEIANATLREMDFELEMRNAERLRRHSTAASRIPRTLRELTTRRVLTMEFIDGVSLARIQQLIASGRQAEADRLLPGLDWDRVGAALAASCLRQLVVTGVFHGDPHPGNVIIRPNHTIAFVDFGLIGELSADDRRLMRDYVVNTVRGDIEGAWRAWLRLAPPTSDTDMIEYRRESMEILARWHAASAQGRQSGAAPRIGHYQNRILDTLRRHHVPLPPDHLFFWRALLILDAIAIQPPLRLEVFSVLRRFVTRFDENVPLRAASLLASPAALARIDLLTDGVNDVRRLLTASGYSRHMRVKVRPAHVTRSTSPRLAEAAPLLSVSFAIAASAWTTAESLSSALYAAAALGLAATVFVVRKRRVASK